MGQAEKGRGARAAKQRPDLSAIIGGRKPVSAPLESTTGTASLEEKPRRAHRQLSRVGKSPIPAHLPDAAYKQLRILGIDQNKTVQRMAEEAFNDYFAKHGLPEIAGSTGS
jgi:hypothetical protein